MVSIRVSVLALLAIGLIASFQQASALKCYKCDSKNNADCEKEPTKVPVVECKKQDASTTAKPTDATSTTKATDETTTTKATDETTTTKATEETTTTKPTEATTTTKPTEETTTTKPTEETTTTKATEETTTTKPTEAKTTTKPTEETTTTKPTEATTTTKPTEAMTTTKPTEATTTTKPTEATTTTKPTEATTTTKPTEATTTTKPTEATTTTEQTEAPAQSTDEAHFNFRGFGVPFVESVPKRFRRDAVSRAESDFECYKLVFKEGEKEITERGCQEKKAGCDGLKHGKTGAECESCEEDECNSSSILSIGIMSVLIPIGIVALFAR